MLTMEGIGFAGSILTRAVTFDNAGRYTESLVCYQEGLQIIIEALKSISDEDKRVKLRLKIEEYMQRAEKVKQHIEGLKSSGKYREQIQVEDNAIGYSYHSVFSRFLDHTVSSIEVEDPYIRSPHQCDNFLRFVELCLKQCSRLSRIRLVTGKDTNSNQMDQQKRLETLQNSLKAFQGRNVQLKIDFSDTLHDREIRVDNGWVIKVGRGLDYFQKADRFNIGYCDFDLRPCRATSIDIFHRKELEKCH